MVIFHSHVSLLEGTPTKYGGLKGKIIPYKLDLLINSWEMLLWKNMRTTPMNGGL